MAFRFPFSKPKEPQLTAPAAPPPLPPAAVPRSDSKPPPPPAPAPVAPASTMIRLPPQAKTLVPRQGTLAAALKAATAQPPAASGGSQSALFKPKVNVTLGHAPARVPTAAIPRLPSAIMGTPSSPGAGIPASIDFAFSDLAPLLPDNLVRADAPPDTLPTSVSISTSEILPQLASGKVHLPLSLLTHSIPPESIDPSIASSGDVRIKIPLHLIIPKLPASAMSLPSSQSKQELDPKIAAPFTERGARRAATPPPSAPAETAPPATPAPVQPRPPRAPVPAPAKPTLTIRPPTLPSAAPKPFEAPTTPAAGVGPTILAPTGLKLSPGAVPKPASPPSAPAPAAPVPTASPTPPSQLWAKPMIARPPLKLASPVAPSASPPRPPAATPAPSVPPPLPAPSIPRPSSPAPTPAARPPVPAIPPAAATPKPISIPPAPPAAMPAPAAPRPTATPMLPPAALPRAMPTLRSPQPTAAPRPSSIPPAPPAMMPVSAAPKPVTLPGPPAVPASRPAAPLNIKLPPISPPPLSPPSLSAPSLPRSAPPPPEALVAARPLPRPKTAAMVPPDTGGPSIQQLLGVPEAQTPRLQDVVEMVRQKLGVPGLLVAAQDGLPLAGKMPEGLDANAWSGIGPQLFRKFGQEGKVLELGKPRRCLLGLGPNWFTLWSEQGIYLICCHGIEKVNPEFDQASSTLAAGLTRFCKQHATAA